MHSSAAQILALRKLHVAQDIVIDFCSNLLHKAVDQAALRGTKLQPEDVMFLLRKVCNSDNCKTTINVNYDGVSTSPHIAVKHI